MKDICGPIKDFFNKHPNVYDFLKDFTLMMAVAVALGALLYLYTGVWPPMVSVISESMVPNMEKGDIVLIRDPGKCDINTYENSIATGYISFNDYGDVIVYRPDGDTSRTPVIHRAIRYVNRSEPMWPGGPVAPWSGYITRGDDNNGMYDQVLDISPAKPIKKEWVIGVSKYRIPYLGYLRPGILG